MLGDLRLCESRKNGFELRQGRFGLLDFGFRVEHARFFIAGRLIERRAASLLPFLEETMPEF